MKENAPAPPKLHSFYVCFHCHFHLIIWRILRLVISNYEGEARWGVEKNEEKKIEKRDESTKGVSIHKRNHFTWQVDGDVAERWLAKDEAKG